MGTVVLIDFSKQFLKITSTLNKFHKWKSRKKLQSSVHKRLFCKIYATPKNAQKKLARVLFAHIGRERVRLPLILHLPPS